ncbi:hypothetical protein GCM10029978_067170 [Actinoallomurus acanthiterrae]
MSHPATRAGISSAQRATPPPDPAPDAPAAAIADVLEHAADRLDRSTDQDEAFTAGPAVHGAIGQAGAELLTATAEEVLLRHLGIPQMASYRADKATAVEALRAAAATIAAPYPRRQADALAHRLQVARDRLCTAANVSPACPQTLEDLLEHVISRVRRLEAGLASRSAELEQQRARADGYAWQALRNPRRDPREPAGRRAAPGVPEATAGSLRAKIRHLEQQLTWLRAAAAYRAAIPIISVALHDAWPAVFAGGFEHDVARFIADRLREHARERHARARANGLDLPDLDELIPDAA